MGLDIFFKMQASYVDIDMMGRDIKLPSNPQRIISLVPSLTELLFDLELEEKVIGITKFCTRPEQWHKTKIKIGGTKTLNFDKIKSLNPDLIIANKEENTKEEIEEIAKSYSVWISDINNYKDALIAIKAISKICNKETNGENIIKEIESKKTNYSNDIFSPKSVLYLIWKSPYMAVGRSTFIDDILKQLGYKNIFTEERYKEISIDRIKELNPDFIFLSSEPYPFKEKHIKEFNKELPNTECKLVDGELFSWYGSRLKKTFSQPIFI